MPEKMPEEFDIGRVIQSGSRQMDLGDLAKMGHRKVRVIDERRIRELIGQAVQKAIERESADVAARERRTAAEKTKAELEQRLAEYQQKLDKEQLASRELEKLRGELDNVRGQLRENTAVIDAEKRRIAEESQREFQNLLKSAQQGLEEKKGLYEKALRGLIENANQSIPRDEREDLPVVAVGADVPATEMLDALSRRVERLGQLLEDTRGRLAGRDQDIAMGAAEHRRQQLEIDRLRREADGLRLEARDKERQLDAREQDVALAASERRKQQEVVERLGAQIDAARDQLREKDRQIDQREQDVAMAALEQRRLREDLNRARADVAKAAEVAGELRRLTSERELLMVQLAEYRDRERSASERVAELTGKLTEVHGGGGGGGGKGSEELMQAIHGMKGSLSEEIARQVGWALSAQKSGAHGAVDAGLQLDALFSQEIETNIESVKVEERKDTGLTDKLAKLRQARAKPPGGS